MRARYLIIGGVIVLAISWLLGNASYQSSHKQAKAIAVADVAGTDTVAYQAKLAAYVKAHMQSSVSVMLSGSYDRAKLAAEAAANPNSTGAVYAQAQAACTSKADSIVQSRCVAAYVAAHSKANPNPVPVAMPSAADYTKTYLAPLWTPDATGFVAIIGWLALITGIAMAIGRLLGVRK